MINPELVEKFASGDGVFFVGAGLSIGGGLRSWDELMRPLREDLRTARTIAGKPIGDLDHLPHLALAQAYEAEINRVRLIELMRSNLPRHGGAPTEVHAALFKVPIREIYTTNFDEFIEMAALKQRRTYLPVVRPADADDTAALSNDGAPAVRIVKIHGDYDDKESIIITQEDYRHVRELKGRIWTDMDQMFRTKTVLFLGYSFNDPDLQNLLRDVRQRAGRFPRNAYALHLENTPGEKERLREIGIQTIPLPVNRKQTINEAVADWLGEFAASVAEHSHRAGPVNPVPHNLPPRRPLVGREEELRALLPMLEWEGSCITLCGSPGVGKTNLALAAAYHCAETGKLFKYVVWISARGRPPDDLLTGLLTAVERRTGYSLGLPAADNSPLPRIENFLSVAKRHGLLVVIDHLEPHQKGEGLARILNEDLGPSCILVTAEGSDSPGGVLLNGLSDADAVNFLTSLIRSGPSDHPLVDADDRRLVDFAQAFDGNPMLLNLAFHLVSNDLEVRDLVGKCLRLDKHKIPHYLHEMIWARLPEGGRELLLITREFAAGSIDAKALCKVSQMDFRRFMAAIEKCRAYGLLEADSIGDRELARIRVHPTTIEFVNKFINGKLVFIGDKDELSSKIYSSADVQQRIIEYYLDLLHRCAKRRRPDKRYWNALVSEPMRDLDAEWANIRRAARWTSVRRDPSEFLDFAMLLVHYMDSRLFNTDRLLAVDHAIKLLTEQADWEGVAVLHLDALAWTHMEQGRLDEALEHVENGVQLARQLPQGQPREDLETLGLAWRARLALEDDRPNDAERLAAEALERDSSAWIRVRALMVDGDVALRAGLGKQALDRYEDALQLAARAYGSEGSGYELLPRIGLACIKNKDLERARATFRQLADASEIPVARLYAEYGLGLADHQERNSAEARGRLSEAGAELRDRQSRMLLLKAFEDQYEAQRASHRNRLNEWHTLGQPLPQPSATPEGDQYRHAAQ